MGDGVAVVEEKKVEKQNCYVYALLDTRHPGTYKYGEYSFDYEPYYIGKGTTQKTGTHYSNREYRHLRDAKNAHTCNPFKTSLINKILESGNEFKSIRICENLSDTQSFKIEIEIIKLIGRRCFDLGPLTNLTDGGMEHPI